MKVIFFFMLNFKRHFKPNGSRMFFAQELFYAVVFFFDPLRSVGISQILCMVSEILRMLYDI